LKEPAAEVEICAATETEPEKFPPFVIIFGIATVNAKVTLRVKAVVLVTPPLVEVMVTGKLPAGVDPLVPIFITVEHAGVQEADEKDPVAPEGRPYTRQLASRLKQQKGKAARARVRSLKYRPACRSS